MRKRRAASGSSSVQGIEPEASRFLTIHDRLAFCALAALVVTIGVAATPAMPAPLAVCAMVTVLLLLVVAVLLASSARASTEQLHTAMLASIEYGQLDALTKLPNRGSFVRRLDAAVKGKPADHRIAVAFFDLDGFKDVNDSLGHEVGDALLEAAASRMRALLKPGEITVRLGGDEFSAMMTGPDAGARATEFVEGVIASLQEPFAINGSMVSVGASAGIAVSGDGAETRTELLRRADVAMYRAKAQSRGTYRIFSADMDDDLITRRTLQSKLGSAIRERELRLFYQPIFCARSGDLAGAEALVRWPRSDGLNVSPGEFIPVAEESGQILELGRWALETALDQARRWKTVPISVNVSPLQIRHHDFARMVGDCLLNSRVDPSLLKIEITEGVLISHGEAARGVIRQLQDLGVSIVLDDFGAGFSSLGYLRRYRFDTLKIDRSFVWDLDNETQASQLIRAMIDLSHGLGMTVVAEGIESERQAAVLRLLGCDLYQGYHLGVPMKDAEFATRFLQLDAHSGAGRPKLVGFSQG